MILFMDDLVVFVEVYLDIMLNLIFINDVVDFICCDVDVFLCVVYEVMDDVVGRKFV